ncbi:class II glutamine amidotransferase [Nocardia sp. NBC_01503]|uniref:class II glutamine amidotransferase n=1 Tax=Nocardia sp. NBC_01503 TaxID=2975997 RepID=UPI002E7C2D31|nr:class II glutamine amidotransferase [Nocardia sp. NBC_01503]WTL35572.1 class II glutamine amidotransferase [Nocardia sp. NBC_01503]
MCRHLAYLGPPVPVGDLLTRGPHSLRTQSWAPRDMRGGGTINADGFGIAWWTPTQPASTEPRHPGMLLAGIHTGDGPTGGAGSRPTAHRDDDRRDPASNLGTREAGPSRYRNAAPIWTDPAVDEVLPQIYSRAVLAAIRSATVGMPVERTACAPFTHGRWAFSHNGVIPDWRGTLTAVAAKFDSPSLLEAESMTDSAALWVILRGRMESEATPDVALREVVRAVAELSPSARLNLLVGDGETVWATAWRHALSVLVGEEFVVVASEPYDDDPRWQAIADRQLVVARPGWLSVQDLDIEIGRAGS